MKLRPVHGHRFGNSPLTFGGGPPLTFGGGPMSRRTPGTAPIVECKNEVVVNGRVGGVEPSRGAAAVTIQIQERVGDADGLAQGRRAVDG
jgi:hypothetical protein